MAVDDDALRSAFTAIADNSGTQIAFRAVTPRELSTQLEVQMGRSPNPIYEFVVSEPHADAFRVIAYTLFNDASKRVATRASALAGALATAGEAIFDLNPFLLIYDLTGIRFMGVPAATLFGAFAHEAAIRQIAMSESAKFSLSPNFENRTVNMYGTVGGADIWLTSISSPDLDVRSLLSGLKQMRAATAARTSEFPQIISAIRSRLNATVPAGAVAGMAGRTVAGAIPDDGEELTADEIDFDLPEPEVRVPPRVWRMIMTAIESSPGVILVGPPGTGKTSLLRKAIHELGATATFAGVEGPRLSPLWATPDESWTARELVGGETVSDNEIVFRPGWVLRSIAENRWLVLDEANRADMDRIFGGLLTWLSGGTVSLGLESTKEDARRIELGWKTGTSQRLETDADNMTVPKTAGSIRYLAGQDWRLLGTYNALDAQRVFRFGAALGRRFVRVPIPAAEPSLFALALGEQAADLPDSVRSRFLKLYEAHYADEATRLGPALFLSMCRYVRASKVTRAEPAIEASDDVAATPPVLPAAVQIGDGAVSNIPELPAETAAASATPLGGEGDGPGAERGDLSIEADTSSTAETSSQIFAEAYVVNAGTWLAHLEERDLRNLETRVVGAGAMDATDWDWLKTMILALA